MGHKFNTYVHICNLISNLQLFGQIQIVKTFYIQNKRVHIPKRKEKISSALVNKIVAQTGDGNFYVVPVTKGDIHETKLQTEQYPNTWRKLGKATTRTN